MKTLTAHGIIAMLCDSRFEDWRLNVDIERQLVGQKDWPLYAAAFADLSGGLEDLADECDVDALLDLVRHGLYLFKSGIITEQQVVDARNAVLHAVLAFGEAAESTLHQVVENN